MEAACHYATLGVTADALEAQIKNAYAQALKKFRERMNSENPLPVSHFEAIREAYRVLSDPACRAEYDLSRHATSPSSSRSAISESPLSTAAAPPSAPPRVARDDEEIQVAFRGNGGEYFRIWLVNMVLSFLTLGIYSAWAKVRREKYFHCNLIIDGAALNYHGKPKAILLGRILLVILLAILSVTDKLGGAAKLGGLAFFGLAFPWLMVQSMRFRARNTSYRGVRLSFSGTYQQALLLYLVHGGLSLITLGIYVPAFIQKQKAFLASHLHFGDRQCNYAGQVSIFYSAMKAPLILGVLAQVLLIGSLFAIVIPIIGKSGMAGLVMAMLFLQAAIVALVLVYSIVVPWIRVVGINLFWNHLSYGKTTFISTQKVGSYIGLIVTNWLMTVLTLGFFWPFAQIRLANFRANNLSIASPQTLREAVSEAAENPAALGSEALDVMGLDVSF